MRKLFFILLFIIATPAFAYYNPGTPDGFVNDFGGMMIGEEVAALEAKLVVFEAETSNEIAVVTIPSLNEDVIENFAVDLFKEWGIGKKSNDNGVLILVARDDREMRIEVGYGLEGALSDAQSFWIIENIMKPNFKAGNYFLGIDGAIDNIILATKGEYVPSESESQGDDQMAIGNIFYFIIFGMLWFASILGRSKSWWAGGVIGGIAGVIIGIVKGFLFFGIASMAILVPFGLLFDFIVSKNYAKGKARGHIPWWVGGGRGGGRGGFGGGFGGFGSGGSGGGGSSGSW